MACPQGNWLQESTAVVSNATSRDTAAWLSRKPVIVPRGWTWLRPTKAVFAPVTGLAMWLLFPALLLERSDRLVSCDTKSGDVVHCWDQSLSWIDDATNMRLRKLSQMSAWTP